MALVIVVATCLAYGIVAAYANVQLPRVASFLPTIMAITFVADLVVAVLLYAQFSATGSRALLVLATGYLYSSLIVIPHALTYPLAFSPTGLFGAQQDSAGYLSVLWRSGLSFAFLCYALLVAGAPPKETPAHERRNAIVAGVTLIPPLVCALTWLVIAGDRALPDLFVGGRLSLWGHGSNAIVALLSGLAALILWKRGKSALDLWLTIAACALMLEATTIVLFVTARFTFGFYALRVTSLAVSKVVLVALLWETMRAYANLWTSNLALQRERANRMTSAEAVVASIAHEIRQPLTNINLLAFTGQSLLDRASPDVSAAKRHFGEIEEDAFRVNAVFDGVLRFFRGGKQAQQSVDVNALTLEAIGALRRELDDHQVIVETRLAPDLPPIAGHPGQLREVMLNLLQNSVEAMAPMAGGPRTINITTVRLGPRSVSLSIQDAGPGIEPEVLANIFDAFVTTKAEGTGLGLAISKMIVEQHGGELSAAPAEGGGARFVITLPSDASCDIDRVGLHDEKDRLQPIQ